MAERAGRKMKLTITECRHVYTGVNKKGDSYDIFEIEASKAGERINEKLRSFDALTVGVETEVNVVPFESEKHGKSFTLYPIGASKARSTSEGLNELRAEVAELGERVRLLFARVDGLQQMLKGAPAGTTPAANAALDEKFGEDAPW